MISTIKNPLQKPSENYIYTDLFEQLEKDQVKKLIFIRI